jgi:hypothetical protein
VSAYTGWLDLNAIVALWPQAPDDDAFLELLRSAAIAQLEEYATAAPEGSGEPDGFGQGGFGETAFGGIDSAPIPNHWNLALLMQIQNLQNASVASPSGGDEFVFRPYPLDRVVKGIIRPRKGRPLVG